MAVFRWIQTRTRNRQKVACVFDFMVPEQDFDFRNNAVHFADMVARRQYVVARLFGLSR